RLLLWSFDFAEVERLQAEGDWEDATALMADAARRLAVGGAELLVIASNTMHRMADAVEAAGGVPLIHIADATAAAARRLGVTRPALLATRYTMEQPFYKGRLRDRHGLDAIVPDAGGRELVHRVIYEELCLGVVRPESKRAYLEVVEGLRRQGADGVILGCTEVGMLIGPDDVNLPVLDTARLHAEAVVDAALA
ncbi:MAG: amino acid racemase, partial [Burkholderia sp.]|nr:amino acid racemase [Burkholderia sp.]